MGTRAECYVAIKILTADATVSETESSLLKAITQSELPHPGKQHVVNMKDYFTHTGPNGEHGCLVFEPMGRSSDSMLEDLPNRLHTKSGTGDRYPIWMAKSILRQALLGLDFLNHIGIAHGDVHPGNFLFSAKDLTSVGEDILSQPLPPKEKEAGTRVERNDGKVDLWAPKYLYDNEPLTEFINLDQDFVIKVSDMGCGSFFSFKIS